MKIDILIVGGGPAGLAAAQYGARSALSVLCVEAIEFGGQALVIDALENYPGREQSVSGFDFADEMKKQALAFGAQLRTANVNSICIEEDEAHVKRFNAVLDDGGKISAKAVILASGAGHRLLGVEGEDLLAGRGVSYCASCDGPFFKNKKIFVAGGGDAACDESMFLSRISSSITLLVRRDAFRAQQALVKRVLENPSIKVRFNTKVSAVKGQNKLETLILEDTKTGLKTEEPADALFVFAGIVPRNDLAVSFGLELDASGFVKTDGNMQTSVPGVFAAGDLRVSPFRQVVTAVSDGAVAAHAAAAFITEQA
jgi:thioredoxin reductase (NADPH)